MGPVAFELIHGNELFMGDEDHSHGNQQKQAADGPLHGLVGNPPLTSAAIWVNEVSATVMMTTRIDAET